MRTTTPNDKDENDDDEDDEGEDEDEKWQGWKNRAAYAGALSERPRPPQPRTN